MGARNKSVDTYIASSRDFAHPILRHIRALVHKACPDVEEAMKWGFPHFNYKGMMCNIAAFKGHCALGFWEAPLLPDPHHLFAKKRDGMGHFGRITSLKDLPADRVLLAYIRSAAQLNEEGVKLPPKQKKTVETALKVPAYLRRALQSRPEALTTFRAFSPSNKREYIEWLEEARTEATRQTRLETALGWMAEGKPRNWKYMKRNP